MNEQIQRQLQERIEAFAGDITAILQRAVADSVTQALAGRPGARGGQRSSAAKASPARAFNADALLREIKRVGDRRIEELSKTLRVPSKSLKAPLKKLIADKKVKTSGKARGTKYRAA